MRATTHLGKWSNCFLLLIAANEARRIETTRQEYNRAIDEIHALLNDNE